jgi:molecular chaperone GrpE
MSTSEQRNGQAPMEGQPDSAVSQETTAENLQAGPAVDELTALRLQVEEKIKEAKANYDLFLRERAENENFKRRMQREKSEAIRFANEPLVRDILPVLDNLERAIVHAQGGSGGQSLIDGVTLVVRSFLETLEKHGVSRVSAKGQLFDPTKHEAMAQVESTEVAPNTVIDEYAPAYVLHDRLLRPALVTVAKAPSEEKKSDA